MDSDSYYRKGLTVGDARNRQFKVYDKPKEKYNFVDKIIIQFKKGKMQNDYGVYKVLDDGTEQWMITEDPLVLGSYEDAIDNLSFAEAAAVATYLTNFQGTEFRVGRPNDRHPS